MFNANLYSLLQSLLLYPLHPSLHLGLSLRPCCPSSIWRNLSLCELSCHNNSTQCPFWILICYVISLSHKISPLLGISLYCQCAWALICINILPIDLFSEQTTVNIYTCEAICRSCVAYGNAKVSQLLGKVTSKNVALSESLHIILCAVN